MQIKKKIILLIHASNGLSLSRIKNHYSVSDEQVRAAVKWFNNISKKNIVYKNGIYFISSKLTIDEINFLKDRSKLELFIEVGFYALIQNYFNKKKYIHITNTKDLIIINHQLTVVLDKLDYQV